MMRQGVGVLIVSAGLMFSIGLLWDEIWHRRYGGFGDDFLWPPHMLLYSSMGIVAGIGVWGLTGLRSGSGGLRERVRGEPVITAVSLLALYLTLSAPSDSLWHEIYGIDLTAWSLPHLLLFGGMAVVLTSSILLLRVGLGMTDWRVLRHLGIADGLSIFVGGMALSLFMQLGTTEWDNITTIVDPQTLTAEGQAFWNRPEWLYPVVLVTIGFFVGTTMVHALRRVGTATLVGLVALALRIIANALFDGTEVGLSFTSQLLVLVPLLVVDLTAGLQLRRASTPRASILHSAGGAVLALAIILPVVAVAMVYPRITISTAPAMIGWGVLMAIGACWLGTKTGALLHTQTTENTNDMRTTPAAVGLLTAAAIVLVATAVASPPAG